jgi:hypothetical protein
MGMDRREVFEVGCEVLEAVLLPKGFRYVKGTNGRSSGGLFSSSKFVKADRTLEIHLRHSLGLVTYHMGTLSLSHQEYMHAVLGPNGKNKYPGFSDDPLDAFCNLASDLQDYCRDFLSGSSEQFARWVEAGKRYEKLSGIAKLTQYEG